MAISFYPSIAEEDFDAIKRLAHLYFVATHGDWLRYLDKSVAEDRGMGFEVARLVEVKPDEFREWLTRHRGRDDFNGLRDFAGERASREPH